VIRIESHFNRFKLWKRDVARAELRYVLISLSLLLPLTLSCRPTGWHGKDMATTGGHLTVDFKTLRGEHVTTHHVHRKDAAYGVSASDQTKIFC
jgi:hypothetical protein